MVDMYCNRDNRGVLKDMRVIQKEEKNVNRVHQWCIVLCHSNLKGTELHAVE